MEFLFDEEPSDPEGYIRAPQIEHDDWGETLLIAVYNTHHLLSNQMSMEYLSEAVTKALQLAINAHAGQKDKAGKEYIHHPVTVAMILAKNGFSDSHIAAALLHDVVEDTEYTLEDLSEMGFPQDVIEALKLLTHGEAVPYFAYVEGVKINPIARAVKMADLLHNLDQSRIADPTDADRQRWSKYREALKILQD